MELMGGVFPCAFRLEGDGVPAGAFTVSSFCPGDFTGDFKGASERAEQRSFVNLAWRGFETRKGDFENDADLKIPPLVESVPKQGFFEIFV